LLSWIGATALEIVAVVFNKETQPDNRTPKADQAGASLLLLW